MSKMLSLIAGVSALALAGAASAGGPVSLTNTQMDVVTAGSSSTSLDLTKNLSSTSTNNVNFTGKSNITDYFNKYANINVKSRVIGNSASLAFDNEAIGKNSNVQGSFSQGTVAGTGSSQSGLFVSAANGRVYTPMYTSK
jgi:ABC-type glycerol-3-phosphate transport system substrate-binding protein